MLCQDLSQEAEVQQELRARRSALDAQIARLKGRLQLKMQMASQLQGSSSPEAWLIAYLGMVVVGTHFTLLLFVV